MSTYDLLAEARAADLLDRATLRIAGVLDETDTDEGAERVQTELNDAILTAIADVAREHGC